MKSSSLILAIALILMAAAEITQAQGMRLHPYDESSETRGIGRDYYIRRSEEARADAQARALVQPHVEFIFRAHNPSPQGQIAQLLAAAPGDSMANTEFKQLALQVMAEINAGIEQGKNSNAYVQSILDLRFAVNMEGAAAKKTQVITELANRIRAENRRILQESGVLSRPIIRL